MKSLVLALVACFAADGQIVSANLLAQYAMVDASGTALPDSSGNGYNGTLINGPVTGMQGVAFSRAGAQTILLPTALVSRARTIEIFADCDRYQEAGVPMALLGNSNPVGLKIYCGLIPGADKYISVDRGTTLAASIGPADTSITLTSIERMPAGNWFTIDSEAMVCSNLSGNTYSGCSRPSSAAPHSAGAPVRGNAFTTLITSTSRLTGYFNAISPSLITAALGNVDSRVLDNGTETMYGGFYAAPGGPFDVSNNNGQYQLGGDDGEYFSGTIYYALFYSDQQTNAQIAQNAAAIQAIVSARGVPARTDGGQANNVVVCEGTSIEAYGGPPWCKGMILTGVASSDVLITAQPGGVYQNIAQYTMARDAPLTNPPAARNILILGAPTNDLASETLAQTQGYYSSAAAQGRTAGFTEIYCGYMLSRGGAGVGGATFDVLKNQWNAWLTANYSSLGCTNTIPWDSRFTADGAYSNPSPTACGGGPCFSADGVHPSDQGFAAMSVLAAPVINQVTVHCTEPVFDKMSLSFGASGGSQNVSVSLPGSCGWNVVVNAPWLTAQSLSGSGSGSLTVSAAPNNGSTRTGSIALASKTIAVSQSEKPCAVSLAPAPAAFSASGGMGSANLTIALGCSWSASVSAPGFQAAPWIQIAQSAGQGSGSIPFTVSANPGSVARTGSIVVGYQSFQITQAAGPWADPLNYATTIVGGGESTGFKGIATDSNGNVYAADSQRALVVRFDSSGGVTTVAGGGGSLGDGGPANAAMLLNPLGLALDASGNLYVSDSAQNRVRKVDANGIITTYAGNGTAGYSGDGGPASQAQLNAPRGIAVDASGNLLLADSLNHRIRKVLSNGAIVTVAGTGIAASTGDGGPAAAAEVWSPSWVAADSAGNVFFAEMERIRRISAAGIISTVAGGGSGYADGLPALSENLSPKAFALGPGGVLYESDNRFPGIHVATPGGVVHTLGVAGDPSLTPDGLAVDAFGAVYGTQSSVFKLTPAASWCTYTVPQPPPQASAGSIWMPNVGTQAGCPWSSSSATPWIAANANNSLTIGPNTSGAMRSGVVAVAGQAVTIAQNASIGAPGAFVTALYQDLFNRAPDAAGFNFYLNELTSGAVTRAQLASQFFTSAESSASGLYLIKLYTALLNRDPDFAGWSFWFSAMVSGTSPRTVLNATLNSSEFQSAYGGIADHAAFVALLYNNVLGRSPDPGGLQYWVGLLNAGTLTRAGIADQFVRSAEYDERIRPRAYANLLYMGFLRRTADPAGLAYWSGVLTNPGSLPGVINAFIGSNEYIGRF